MERGDISDETGLGLVVVALEQSLQHVHKLILQFPPANRAGGASQHQ
jgi:hypothetical protein